MIFVLIPGGKSETVGIKYPIKIKVKLSSAERVRKSMVVRGEKEEGEKGEGRRGEESSFRESPQTEVLWDGNP